MAKRQSIIEATKAPSAADILAFLHRVSPRRASQAGDGRERTTAGFAGLHPADRLAVTKFEKQREHTDKAVAGQRQSEAEFVKPDGDIPTDTLAAQIGRPLHHTDIMKRLKRLNPNFHFEQSKAFPEIMGIYFPDPNAPEGRIHVMGFEYNMSPEFTVRHPDAQGPKKITRGWRAVILNLSKLGYINFTAACKAFHVEKGRSSLFWKEEVERLSRGA